jgi:hypothetical protein
MVLPLNCMNQVRDEGNCGEVTNRGEEACECVGKLIVNRRQPHSRQSCEVTNRNRIQGRGGQVSEPNITKPSSFIHSGKSGACAAKVTRLIQGDPSFVSARRACSKAERNVVNTSRDRRKSAEVVVPLLEVQSGREGPNNEEQGGAIGQLATREPLQSSRPVSFRRRRTGDHRFNVPTGIDRCGAGRAASLESTRSVSAGSSSP